MVTKPCNCIDFSCFHDSFTSDGYGHASLSFDQLHSRLGELGVGFARVWWSKLCNELFRWVMLAFSCYKFTYWHQIMDGCSLVEGSHCLYFRHGWNSWMESRGNLSQLMKLFTSAGTAYVWFGSECCEFELVLWKLTKNMVGNCIGLCAFI